MELLALIKSVRDQTEMNKFKSELGSQMNHQHLVIYGQMETQCWNGQWVVDGPLIELYGHYECHNKNWCESTVVWSMGTGLLVPKLH